MGNWLDHWNLNENPFDTRYLSYRDPHFYDLFVLNDSVKKFDEYFSTIIGNGSDRSLLILGERASGKTTLLNYLFLKILQMKERNDPKAEQILPILLSFKSGKALKSVDNMVDYFYKGLARSLRFSLSNAENLKINPYKEDFLDILADLNSCVKDIDADSTQVEGILEDTCQRIKKYFSRSILIIDNLDKASIKRASDVEDFINQSQGFMETVLWENGFYTVLIGPAFWIGLNLEKNTEFSWIYDTHIYMQRWKFECISELLARKINQYTKYSNYSLDKYFTEDALKAIYESNRANPRFCIRAAKTCLLHGWKNGANRITLNFLKNHPYLIQGSVEESELRVFYYLDKRISSDTNVKIAYSRLINIFLNNKDKSMNLAKDIIKLYNEEFETRKDFFNYDLLVEHKLVSLPDPTSHISSHKNVFSMDSTVKRLIQYLFEELDDDENRVRTFIIQQFGT